MVNADFRNNASKCAYNDKGYCKFKDECRKQHFSEVCEEKDYKKECNKRHPKECRWKNKCKFLAKNVCAFSHSVKVQRVDKLDHFENEIKALKDEIEALKVANKVLEDKVMEYSKHQSKWTPFQTTISKSGLKEVIYEREEFKCGLCSKSFDSEAKIKLHRQRNHLVQKDILTKISDTKADKPANKQANVEKNKLLKPPRKLKRSYQ